MRLVTFDIETKNTFADVGGREPSMLDLSLVSIHDTETEEFSSYFEEDLSKLGQYSEVNASIGFNSNAL
ncbi:MAG: hypothetical protein U5L75_02255 [Candidatus Campbellbacteria bacterium]|nr:hypothetical protein [Candidatus Campbellbacteria bacterium]